MTTTDEIRERIFKAAMIELDQVSITVKNFAVDAFLRGDDRCAVVARDICRMLEAHVEQRTRAVRQSLGLPTEAPAS